MALRVVIVGGEAGEIASLARLLRGAGAETVSSPGEPSEPDPRASLVLLDHGLLATGGEPLLERLRVLHPQAQICLLAPFAHHPQAAGSSSPALWDALYLPAQREDVEDLVVRSEAYLRRRERLGRKRRILVVDDEASVREASVQKLGQLGHEADSAVDALEAFGKLYLHPYDLVITDLQMPGMDGVTLLGKIRGAFPRLPVVLATGYATVDTAVAALRTGATDFLRKPFTAEDFVQVVERALRYGDLARANLELEDLARAEKFRLRERQYELRVLAEAIAGMSQAGHPAQVAEIWLRAAYRVVDFACGALFLVYPEPELILLDTGNEACVAPELFEVIRRRAPSLVANGEFEGLRVRRIEGIVGRAVRAGVFLGDAQVRLLGPAERPCAAVVLLHVSGEEPTPAQESFLRSLSAPAAEALEKQRALAEEARQRERAMVAGMHQGVLLVDPDGRLLVMNAAARELLALSPQDEYRSLSRLQSERGVPVLDAVAELLRSGTDTLLREFALPRPAERIVTLDLTAIRDAALAPIAVVGLLRDITDLREAERLKSEIVTIVSHELRTPLTTIKNCTSLLLGGGAGETTPAQERFLRMTQISVDRIIRLVDDLLDVARIDSGGIPLQLAPVDLAELVREVGNEAEYLLLERELRLVCAGLDAPLTITADGERLKQVFFNLLHNAAKFSPRGATIEVRAAALAEPPPELRATLSAPGLPHVELQVIDQGSGIAPGDVERIFDRFQQAEPTLRREHGGVGLGLPICRGIVRSHGGEIRAEIREGGGSVFRVILPRAAAASATEGSPAGPAAGCRKPLSEV